MTVFQRWRSAIALVVLPLVLVMAACQTAAPQEKQAAPAPAGTDKLFIAADLVQGSKNVPDAEKPLKSCVLTSRFPRNSEMVWRVRVFDPKTGELMDKAALSKVEVRLANGVNIEMQYGPHPKDPPGESFWTGSWVVPKDHPTGTLNYTIVATAVDGRTGEFKPFSTAPSLPSILDEVLADIPTKG